MYHLPILILFMFSTTTGAQDTVVTYDCSDVTLAITLKPFTSNAYSAAVGPRNQSVTNGCLQSLQKVKSQTITVTNCSSNAELVLYLMHHTTDLEKSLGVGAIDVYNITCTGTGQNVSATFDIASSSSPEPVQQTFVLKMVIAPTAIQLGGIVNITITDESNPQHQLDVLSCNASTSDDSEFIELINDGIIAEPSLVAAVKNGTGTAYVWLYGFRFSSSASVKISCDVMICPNNRTCQQTITGSNGRKRNQVTGVDEDNFIQTQTVIGHFNVIEHVISNN